MSYTFDSLQCDSFDVTNQLDMSGFKIVNIAAPVSGSTDVARVQDVNVQVGIISLKISCAYATVTNITNFTVKPTVEAALDLVSATNPTLIDGDRVLVKDQTSSVQNGLYQWDNGLNQLIRAEDHDGSIANEIRGGDYTFVVEGDSLEGSGFIIEGSGLKTVGISPILWLSFTGTPASHTTLTNIGVNTHVQIDTHIADSTVHYLESAIDHVNLSNIGVNTHAVIDSHISSVSNPHGDTFDQVTPTLAKGDLVVRDSTVTTRLAVGSNGSALFTNSLQSTGLEWDVTAFNKTDGYNKFYSTMTPSSNQLFSAHFVGTPSDSSDSYGSSCAVNGGKIVVGASSDDVIGLNAGAVYVFNLVTNVQEDKLFASDAQASDFYGTSVSVANPNVGVYTHFFIVVGAPGEDTGGATEGAAYIIHYNGSVYSEFQKIQASDPTGTSNFGQSVDIDNLGIYVVIGAPTKADGGLARGVVYTFTNLSGVSGTWIQQNRISDPSPISSGHFGTSVQHNSNVTVVGRPGTTVGQGVVYTFDTSANLLQTIIPTDSSSVTMFGNTVRCKSNSLLVGCDTTFNQIYVFKKYSLTGEFVQTQIIVPDVLLNNYFFDLNRYDGAYFVVGGKISAVNEALILSYSMYDGDFNLENDFILYRTNSYASAGGGPAVTSVASYFDSAYINDSGILADIGTYVYSNLISTGGGVSVSKDGRWLTVVNFFSTTSSEITYYLKVNDIWLFKFVTSLSGVPTSTPLICISDINSSNNNYVVSYYQRGAGTDQTIYQRIILDDDTLGAESTISTLTKHVSEVTYTPTASSYLTSLAVCWLNNSPYYAFTVLDTPDAYVRHRKEVIAAASDARFIKDVSTKILAPVDIVNEDTGTPVISGGLGDWYIWRLITGPQIISSSASYDYGQVQHVFNKTSTVSNHGDFLFMNPYDPLCKVGGSFTGRLNGYPGARVDLWTNNGSTFDFKYAILQMVSDGSAGQFNGNHGIVEVIRVSTDGTRFIGLLEYGPDPSNYIKHPAVCELDCISNEWMIKYNYYSPKHASYTSGEFNTAFESSVGNLDIVSNYCQAGDSDLLNTTLITVENNIINVSFNKLNLQIDKRYDLFSPFTSTSIQNSYYYVDRHNQLRKPLANSTRALDPEVLESITVLNLPTVYFTENSVSASTNLVAFQSYLSFTQAVDSGFYLLELHVVYGVNSTASFITVRFQQDGTNIFHSTENVVEQVYNVAERSTVCPSTVIELNSTAYTWDISFNNTTGSLSTVYYASIRLTKM